MWNTDGTVLNDESVRGRDFADDAGVRGGHGNHGRCQAHQSGCGDFTGWEFRLYDYHRMEATTLHLSVPGTHGEEETRLEALKKQSH